MSTTQALESGAFVTPTLRLVNKVGDGGMGSVWVADHLALGTQVAVKFILPELCMSDTLVHRLSREANLTAQLRSPHAVQVFDFGKTCSEQTFMVMELLEGESLRDRLNRCGPLSVTESATLLAQLGKLLQRAHARSIIHRDLKPANLFLSNTGYDLFVKVLDFGIAKHLAAEDDLELTASSTIVGTPLYMSPQVIRGTTEPDHMGDLWSLAVVMYECLSGQLPFRASSFGELTLLVHEGVFLAPSEVRPELPKALDAWFERALARDPAARFASAEQMVMAFFDSLGGSIGQRPTFATMPPISEIAAPRARRWPWMLAAAMLTAAGSWAIASTSNDPPPSFFARQMTTSIRDSLYAPAVPLPRLVPIPESEHRTEPPSRPRAPSITQRKRTEYW